MPYKTGSWGDKAKARAKTRNAYFYEYKKRRDPVKVKARYLLFRAVTKGIIIKTSCQVCGELKVEAHHNDYTKALEVQWLCPKHHREIDKKLGLRK